MTTTVLGAFYKRNPLRWWQSSKRPPPSPLQIAEANLDECRIELLIEMDRAEQHAAMVRCLKEREKRLIADIERLRPAPGYTHRINMPVALVHTPEASEASAG